MRLLMCIAVAICLGCGDNAEPPPPTWGDAVEVWSDSWCALGKRCLPERYAKTFTDDDQCRAYAYAENCNLWQFCDELYPRDFAIVEQCADDMAVQPCGERFPPDSCFDAFEQ